MLDRLVIEKLHGISETVREAEGWKWADVHIDYPHANGLRRTYPQPVDLSEEDKDAYATASDEFNTLTEEWDSAEELPDDVDQRFGKLDAEIERIDALRHAFDPDVVARGGVFVVLAHDGKTRIERGFIRAEDEQAEPGRKRKRAQAARTAPSTMMARSSKKSAVLIPMAKKRRTTASRCRTFSFAT